MDSVQALRIALKQEEDAIEFYTNMALEHSVIKELFNDLVNEEMAHKKKIEKRISELTRY